MYLNPGTYRAEKLTVVQLKRDNSTGSHFYTPSVVEERTLSPGETVEIPATVNGFVYYAEDDSLVRSEAKDAAAQDS